jgi:NAD(P)-dependent dehydrogenase (short-subunit alcohol dehydrogenase family)
MLDGLVAAVTGAGNGLGRAEALALARAGARVVLNDLPGDALFAVAEEIAGFGGSAAVCPGDVAEMSTAQALLAAYDRVDVLVNNAGVLRDRMVFSMSEEEWDTVIRVHLRGHFLTTQVVTSHWRYLSKQSDGQVYGRIVNTSSEAFLLGSAGQPNYAAAKAGIVALTLATARGCARYGITANAICPRARTGMTASLMGPSPGGDDPMSPECVAPLVVYLASPASANVSGEVFVVHGNVVAALAPPTLGLVERADGPMWTAEALAERFRGHYAKPGFGFVSEATLPLAETTFGEA